MSEVWVVMAEDYESSEVRAVLTSEEAAIACARELTEREAKKRFADCAFVIEKHQLDAKGVTTGREIVEYLVPRLEREPGRVTFAASVGMPTTASLRMPPHQ